MIIENDPTYLLIALTNLQDVQEATHKKIVIAVDSLDAHTIGDHNGTAQFYYKLTKDNGRIEVEAQLDALNLKFDQLQSAINWLHSL
jgi:hypothetical protein